MYWAIIVASAAPTVPLFKTATNNRSSPIFNNVETPKNTSGMTEFPTAFK